jgi:ankyrin
MKKAVINKILFLYKQKRLAILHQVLNENKLVLNSLTYDKKSSLAHEVCKYGDLELLKLLKKYKVNFEIKNKINILPIDFALQDGADNVVFYLIRRLNKSEAFDLLLRLILKDNVRLIKRVQSLGFDLDIKSVDYKKWPLLFFAIQENKLDSVELLASCSNNINYVCKFGFSALHKSSSEGKINISKTLIKHGANVNLLTPIGTPLHLAAAWGHIKLINLLLKNGAKTNLKDDEGYTPFQLAQQNDQFEVMEILTSKS